VKQKRGKIFHKELTSGFFNNTIVMALGRDEKPACKVSPAWALIIFQQPVLNVIPNRVVPPNV
jgi:hypothetical protein